MPRCFKTILDLYMTCATGEYSAERLHELRANAQLYTGPRAPMSSVAVKPEESNGGGFKLSGSFKPAGIKTDDRFDPPSKEASLPQKPCLAGVILS